MPKMPPTKYTLVQHSGGAQGDANFAKAVELRSIFGKQIDLVATAGGVIFNDYMEALSAEEDENYPPEVTGFVPRVTGSFSDVEIDGLKIYIPAVAVSARNRVA